MSARKATGAEPRKTAADRLCEAATELFYRRGIRAVGVDEIVDTTGVTKPTLYRSFASKDELVATCLRNEAAAASASWDAIAAELADDPLGQLRAIVAGAAAAIAGSDYRGCSLTNAAVEFPEAGHPVRGVTEDCKAALRTRLGELSRRLGIADPDALADGLMLLIEGASSSRHTSGSQGPAAALVPAADALIAAYRAR